MKEETKKVSSPAQSDWEERFEQLFIFHERPSEIAADKYEILDFIRNLLNEAREKERNELKEIIETKLKNDPRNPVLVAGLEYVLTILTNPQP